MLRIRIICNINVKTICLRTDRNPELEGIWVRQLQLDIQYPLEYLSAIRHPKTRGLLKESVSLESCHREESRGGGMTLRSHGQAILYGCFEIATLAALTRKDRGFGGFSTSPETMGFCQETQSIDINRRLWSYP